MLKGDQKSRDKERAEVHRRMDKLEIEDTKKRFKFLLGSENGVLFRKFIEGQKHPAHVEAIIKV